VSFTPPALGDNDRDTFAIHADDDKVQQLLVRPQRRKRSNNGNSRNTRPRGGRGGRGRGNNNNYRRSDYNRSSNNKNTNNERKPNNWISHYDALCAKFAQCHK